MSLTSWFIGSMFMSMAGLLLLGFPVGFTLIVHGVAFTVLGAWLDLFPWAILQAHMLRVYGLLFNEVLLAIPFFTLMGMVLGYFAFRRGMPLAIRSALYPITGKRIHGRVEAKKPDSKSARNSFRLMPTPRKIAVLTTLRR